MATMQIRPADASPEQNQTLTDTPMARTDSRAGYTLADGEILASRYRVVRFIAGGGMGEVYEAHDALLDEAIAIKLLRPDLTRKPGAHERFAEEIRLARRITHRNVCRVFDVASDGERVFFTMELRRGGTLAGRIAQRGAMVEQEASPIVEQLLAGVEAAHAADVVHLDLKPSNVLLGEDDRVVITDFGLAMPCCAELGCGCAMPHLLGTPAYMAPEQVEGIGQAETHTDVFALGVILFEVCTGQLPYRGSTVEALARARLVGDAPSPRAIRPDVGAAWDEVIRACLARDPARRPRGPAAIAAALGL